MPPNMFCQIKCPNSNCLAFSSNIRLYTPFKSLVPSLDSVGQALWESSSANKFVFGQSRAEDNWVKSHYKEGEILLYFQNFALISQEQNWNFVLDVVRKESTGFDCL